MTALTLAPDTTLARMRIVVVDAPPGSSLVRVDPAGEHQVRGGQALDGDVLVDDYEAPFGVPVTWRLHPAGVTATGTLDVRTPWLTHPTDPTLGGPAGLVDDDDWQWNAPGTVHDLLGSEWPIVVYQARTVHTGLLRLTSSWADRAGIERLLRPGSPLLLRTPPGCDVDDAWVWPSTVRRRKAAPHDPPHVWWELTYQRVATPGGLVTQDPSNAWTAVVVTHPTWTDLLAGHSDWLDLLLTPHPHPGGAR